METRPAGCPVPLHRYRPPREIAVAHEIAGRHPVAARPADRPVSRGASSTRRGPFPASGAWWEPAEARGNASNGTSRWPASHLLRLVLQPPDRWQLDGIYR